MIYIFNQREELQAIFSNDDKDACPYYKADLSEELNGPITLEIEIPADHEDAVYLQEDFMVAIQDRKGEWQAFFVRELEEEHEAEKWIKSAFCEHIIVELEDEPPIETLNIDRKDTRTALDIILEGTRWETGTAENTNPHTFTGSYENRLEAFNTFKERWGVEITYRIEIAGNRITRRIIDAVQRIGTNTGKRFEFSKDISSIRRTIDTTQIRTALIGLGEAEETAEGQKEFITFADINGGLNYVGNEEARGRFGRLDNDGTVRHRFGIFEVKSSVKSEILAETKIALETASQPVVQYEAKVIDIARILNVEHEAVHLGQTVLIIDKDLNLKLTARVIKLDTDLLDDDMSDLTLGNFLPVQSESIAKQISDFENRLQNTDFDITIPDDVLREGDPIQTDWLEGAINALQNRVLAGKGTVQITDNDGIIILNDAENPTSAMKLLGGMLAIADGKDEATGLWDWRTFGTGSGFTADEIIAGTMKGVSLELGGANNADGILTVNNERGEETVRLSGNYGGFAEINIDFLKDTKNVVFKTSEYFENLTPEGEIVYYVDPNDGNNAGAGTEADPLASVQEAINRLPKFLEHDVRIYFVTAYLSDDHLTIEGFSGTGRLILSRWNMDIRYIRDFINGSEKNSANHWVEIRGTKLDGSTMKFPSVHETREGMEYISDGGKKDLYHIVDGSTNASNHYDGGSSTDEKPLWVDIYTGGNFQNYFDTIDVFHYHGDGRTYKDSKTQISGDKTRWFTIFDSERQGTYKETSDGNKISVSRAYLKGPLAVRNNTIRVYIDDLFVDYGHGAIEAVTTHNTSHSEINNMVIFGNKIHHSALWNETSFLRITDSEINTAENRAISTVYGGHTHIVNCVGGDVNTGVWCAYGGTASGQGTAPKGATFDTYTYLGGQVWSSWTHKLGKYSPIQIVSRTGSWKNTSSASWTAQYGGVWEQTTDAIQGKYNIYGLYTGLWFWGSTIRNTVRNKTIKKIKVWINRTNTAHGYAQKTPIYIRTHGYSSKPSGEPTLHTDNYATISLNRGESGWVDCTSKFKDKFENGTAYGIGVYVYTSSNTYYARMTANARIEITYEEVQ